MLRVKIDISIGLERSFQPDRRSKQRTAAGVQLSTQGELESKPWRPTFTDSIVIGAWPDLVQGSGLQKQFGEQTLMSRIGNA